MSLQEQLAQSQKPTAVPYFSLLDIREAGLLGNRSSQVPTKMAGSEHVDQAGRTRHADNRDGVESLEMAWLERNAEELGHYKGQWLLIQGTRLLVHDRDFAAVRVAIRERQVRSPFVYYVPTDEESNSVTI